jgi:transcriptional repressor NF-X1
MSRACSENAKEYQRIATSLLASKMADMQLGHSVDIRDLLGNPSTRKMSLKT